VLLLLCLALPCRALPCFAMQDFDKAGYKWTAELCRMDSDGDGFTNGQELGDPDCTWTKGMAQRTSAATSHPGIATSMPPPAASGK
jgi:dopamine beta-monooxygenase